MLKHGFYLALAIAVGLAVAKMFGGSFNLTSLFSGLTTTTPTTTTTIAPCWLAAVAFKEDFHTGKRVKRVRHYLVNRFEKAGPGQRALMALYREYGQRLAARVERSRILSFGNGLLFRAILRQAEAI
jgi:hypothetical protein